ncbi:hypothetical protein L6452_37710 [Arctium lappa]|uniref:Uncharacterized protein n=1 Tax=Arctium lappa TaxID=4217 RepID=A0ACB8Y7W1_ARCLA|nr:hypothetical protein L6452_37710 [Arctium lappa]
MEIRKWLEDLLKFTVAMFDEGLVSVLGLMRFTVIHGSQRLGALGGGASFDDDGRRERTGEEELICRRNEKQEHFSFTEFHEFVEFTAEDVRTSESELNSVVLACNSEMILLPMNEPVYGTKRKSQIQTYLEHNEGARVQHLALTSEDIFRALGEMRKRSGVSGFEFMPSPSPTYYQNLKKRVDDVLSREQIKECEELGILVLSSCRRRHV